MSKYKTRYALILCNDYKPPFFSVACQYASYFDGSEIQPIVVFIKGEKSESIASTLKAEVIFLEASNRETSGLKLKLSKEIKKLHEKYQFEFVVAHRYRAIYMATKLKNIPVYGVCHIDGNFRRLSRRLYIRFCKNLTLIGVSKAIRDDIRKSLPFMPRERIVHLYNSLDFQGIRNGMLSRSEARKRLCLTENYSFINVGRLHSDKDQKTLIEAFCLASKKMPLAQLFIAGKGELEQELKALVDSKNMQHKIKFLGAVPDVYKYLKGFDCFVLSSIREGLPIALLEAYAAELPVIASYCNGNLEAIDQVAKGFPIGDAERLKELLIIQYNADLISLKSLKNKINDKVENNFTHNVVRDNFWKIVNGS
ncbi:glycosyltransferase [Methylophaga lonarensis MPL]|uniref:Glycosyltransferase n=1 Tax=Methylophaga lonarensis MPL TaxID=1286106 RepID=M7PT79_9GAMM|nr:glycosyltransferase [Methylophaga lonarensis]EMR13674.1 glycosyltransferase [Methylophaga lonarensis MPL]